MDVLMGVVLGKHTEPAQPLNMHTQPAQMPRPGRHVLPEGRVSDLPPVLKARTAFPGAGFCMPLCGSHSQSDGRTGHGPSTTHESP
jgi:hypothetical protein